jgi:hypothetical protein
MATTMSTSALQSIIENQGTELLTDWMGAQRAADTTRADLIKEAELREQSRRGAV